MTLSGQEEVIAGLWCICSILCFGFGYTEWGVVLAIKAAIDLLCSILTAFTEIIQ